MAGRVKHMERSHRSYDKGYSEFRRFTVASLHKNADKPTKKKKASILERFARLFKHQSR